MEGHDVRVYVPESTGLNGMSQNCETSHTYIENAVEVEFSYVILHTLKL
jgi:hypothetical protein